MTEKIKLSIIVPVYNVEKYLKRCVDSIIQNPAKDLEIILIDDGSPDECPRICDEYALNEKRVKAIHKKNGGVAAARNTGLEYAKGEYIWFVDSDDYLHEGWEKNIYTFLNDADLLVFSHHIEFVDMKIVEKHILINKENFSAQEALRELEKENSFNFLWNKIYRREVIEVAPKVRFVENSEPGEDLIFNCDYFKRIKKVLFREEIAYCYMRQGEDTLANKFRVDLFKKNQFFISKRKEIYNFLEMDASYDAELLAEGNIRYIFVCIPNMYRKGHKFKRKDRLEFYKEILSSKEIHRELLVLGNLDYLLSQFKKLYFINSPVLMDTFYLGACEMRNHFNNLYLQFRKKKINK